MKNRRQRKTVWVVVADGARARVLVRRRRNGPLTEMRAAIGDARLPTREIASDRPGRVRDRMARASHAMEPKTDAHRYEKRRFARDVGRMLEEAALAGRFDELLLVAPPRVLGDLRAALGEAARGLLTAELRKDLTRLEPRDIAARVAAA